MTAAVLVFKDSMVETERLRAAQEAAKVQAAAEHKAALNHMADGFERKIGGLVGMLSAGSTALKSTAESLTATAGEGNRQAATVAAAAEEASTGLHSVSAASEELTASIAEIGRHVAQSSKITSKAVADAKRTRHDRPRPRRWCRKDRRRGRIDHQHRQPDQPAGPERHDRGRPRR
jgi:methyl-accepting chemotaxis protein